jgi:hypothetical protein
MDVVRLRRQSGLAGRRARTAVAEVIIARPIGPDAADEPAVMMAEAANAMRANHRMRRGETSPCPSDAARPRRGHVRRDEERGSGHSNTGKKRSKSTIRHGTHQFF